MIIAKATGNGQSECRRCKEQGKWSLTWTCMLYTIEGKDGFYCWDCAKKILRDILEEKEDDE